MHCIRHKSTQVETAPTGGSPKTKNMGWAGVGGVLKLSSACESYHRLRYILIGFTTLSSTSRLLNIVIDCTACSSALDSDHSDPYIYIYIYHGIIKIVNALMKVVQERHT